MEYGFFCHIFFFTHLNIVGKERTIIGENRRLPAFIHSFVTIIFFNITLCDKVCKFLVSDWLFSLSTLGFSIKKNDCHDYETEIQCIVKSGVSTHN